MKTPIQSSAAFEDSFVNALYPNNRTIGMESVQIFASISIVYGVQVFAKFYSIEA